MTKKKKMENNWKNCYCVSDETHAFCFQWAHQRDFRRVADVVESVIPGANCSLKIPEHPGSPDDTDLLITGVGKYDDAVVVCNPGDWIFIKNTDVGGLDCGMIPANMFGEYEWEVCE